MAIRQIKVCNKCEKDIEDPTWIKTEQLVDDLGCTEDILLHNMCSSNLTANELIELLNITFEVCKDT